MLHYVKTTLWLFSLAILFGSFPARAAMDLTFMDETKGEEGPTTFNALKGRSSVILFWRSDCPPCLRELSNISDFASAYPNFVFVVVSFEDDKGELPAKFQSLPSNVLHWQSETSTQKALQKTGGHALPYTLVLDRNAEICRRHQGLIGTDLLKKWSRRC